MKGRAGGEFTDSQDCDLEHINCRRGERGDGVRAIVRKSNSEHILFSY